MANLGRINYKIQLVKYLYLTNLVGKISPSWSNYPFALSPNHIAIWSFLITEIVNTLINIFDRTGAYQGCPITTQLGGGGANIYQL